VAVLAASVIACSVTCMLPLLPLMFFAPRTYRALSAFVISTWQAWVAFLLEVVWGIRYTVTGDVAALHSSPYLLLETNHRTRLDWALLWPLLHRAGLLRGLHIVLKNEIKWLPLLGWATQLARYVFLHRKWEADEAYLHAMMTHIASPTAAGAHQGAAPYVVLLFPEGTDLNPVGMEKSNAFAAKQGLPPYTYVLHPRSRGFAAALTTLRAAPHPVTTIVDLTMGFTGPIPQNEKQLVTGKLPERIHIHIRRHEVAAMPTAEADVDAWMKSLFACKERALRKFYADQGADDMPAACEAALQEMVAEAGGADRVPHARTMTAITPASSIAPGLLPGPQRPSVFLYAVEVAAVAVSLYVTGVLWWRHAVWQVAWVGALFLFFRFAAPRWGGMDTMELALAGYATGPRVATVAPSATATSAPVAATSATSASLSLATPQQSVNEPDPTPTPDGAAST